MTRESVDVPADVRAQVQARDAGCCRICGRWADVPGLHHVVFRSQGGLHVPENLVTVGWTPAHDCHLKYAHSPMAGPIRQALQEVVKSESLYALQLLRWAMKVRT